MGILYSQLFITPAYPVKSFRDQTVIVTGSNVGLGKEAARHFARLHAKTIILAVRNTEAGERARQDILQSCEGGKGDVQVWSLDLSSFDSITAFAQRASTLERVDVVIESAGVAVKEFQLADGYERTIMVNVIGTFFLALLLLPTLERTAKQFNVTPNLSIVSSDVHGFAKFNEWKELKTFDALNRKETFNMNQRYPLSKLLEVLIVRQLAPKLHGKGVMVNMLNPGLCHSELSREGGMLLTVMKFLLARTTEVGARTLVAGAVVGPESHGKYMHDGKVDERKLSSFVTSQDGAKAAVKVWDELTAILEHAQPGVVTNALS